MSFIHRFEVFLNEWKRRRTLQARLVRINRSGLPRRQRRLLTRQLWRECGRH